MIKGFNDLIAEQNSNYSVSGDDFYGGFVSEYDIYVMVAPDDTKDDEATWILEDNIPPARLSWMVAHPRPGS